MPSLKDLRVRIGSVKNTRKITSAMKMVAASKFRRAQEQAMAGQPYAEAMASMLARVAAAADMQDEPPRLLVGTGASDVHLVIVVTADRGLAGGFNAQAIREARRQINLLLTAGRTVKIITVGRKGKEALRRDYAQLMVASFDDLAKPKLSFAAAEKITEKVMDLFETGGFDVATVIYNKFKSVIAQVPTAQQIIPFKLTAAANNNEQEFSAATNYDFEPNAAQILEQLLPRNLGIQIYRTLTDNAAGEHAARMQAMDNATRNAGDMIKRLTLVYNRARQAYITKELIEIISGAEAV